MRWNLFSQWNVSTLPLASGTSRLHRAALRDLRVGPRVHVLTFVRLVLEHCDLTPDFHGQLVF